MGERVLDVCPACVHVPVHVSSMCALALFIGSCQASVPSPKLKGVRVSPNTRRTLERGDEQVSKGVSFVCLGP